MKKIKLFSLALIAVTTLGGCATKKEENSSQSSVSTEEQISSSTKETTSKSAPKSSESSSKNSSVSSTSDSSSRSNASSENVDKLEATDNMSEVSYDEDTKTLTTPISKVQIVGQEFNTWKRGTKVEKIFILRYSVENTSDEIFNSANHGSLRYLNVVTEEPGKKFSGLPTRVLSQETDPYHEEYKNTQKRLEQNDKITIATAYAFRDDVKSIYVEFYDDQNNSVKRLQVDVPEN